ncbi:hypothetical protein [Aggregatibacter kilianii]|uniref:hypothetical protein n=1 Tax=Aggregatibacter kilianii TaxID=2025884 RepID=UPI000D653684|nr:hypothetical protein [Aggregatibacter kilianii]
MRLKQFILVSVVIVISAFSPFIVMLIWAYFEALQRGVPLSALNEANSSATALGWLGLATLPLGFFCLLGFWLFAFFDWLKMLKK